MRLDLGPIKASLPAPGMRANGLEHRRFIIAIKAALEWPDFINFSSVEEPEQDSVDLRRGDRLKKNPTAKRRAIFRIDEPQLRPMRIDLVDET